MRRLVRFVRRLAVSMALVAVGWLGAFLGALWFGHGGTWADIRRSVRSRLSWSGISADKQARIRADIRRRRGLGEPDPYDWLPEHDAEPAVGTWTHRHGRVTYIRPVGEACEACGTEEPA